MSLDLFGNQEQEPAPEPAPKAKPYPLFERLLAKFKERKYEAFSLEEIIRSFPSRKPEVVVRALHKLVRNNDVRAMPAEGSKPVRYTKSLYK